VEVLLVEPSIFVDAMFPVIFLEVEVVVEDILATGHFPLLPLRFIEASLASKNGTLG